jgi:protease I
MKKSVLIPIPLRDFDPTETSVPWKILRQAGVDIVFATPTGEQGHGDDRMVSGLGLGPLRQLLAADKNGRAAYVDMTSSSEFVHPIRWSEISPDKYDGILLPGGHAKGMREYLESETLQKCVSDFFQLNKFIGAICHGVVLAARSKAANSKSNLFGRKTTALLASQEISAWLLTCTWLGSYYRTYPETVEAEVKSALASKIDFFAGPPPLFRDDPKNLKRGFFVQDQNYLSARWPGDAHSFGVKYLECLQGLPIKSN